MDIYTQNGLRQKRRALQRLFRGFIALIACAAGPLPDVWAAENNSPQQTISSLYLYTGPVYIELTTGGGAIDAIAQGTGQTLRAFPAAAPAGTATWRNWHYEWTLNGGTISNQTSATLTVSQPGLYAVRLVYRKEQSVNGNAVLTSEAVNVYAGQSFSDRPLNYSASTSVLTPGIAQVTQLASLAVGDKVQVATLTDGFARPLQTQLANGAPNGDDVVKFQNVDAFGDASVAYLPYVRPTANGAVQFSTQPISEQSTFYDGTTPAVAGDSRPYGTTAVESSPLARPQYQYQAGTDWQTKPSRVQYGTNYVSNAHRWKGLDGSAFYATGTLSKTRFEDPEGRPTEEYRDNAGRVVMTRQLTSSSVLDTYNVYDEAGRLQFVIPPGAVAKLAARGDYVISPAADQDFINQWLYEYQYDTRGRLVSRRFPNAEPVEFVYDRFNRLVLTRDGNRRANGEWYFTKFDSQGRPAVEGLYVDGRSQDALQSEADTWGNASGQLAWENRQSTGDYSLTHSFPAAGACKPLSINWYDDYDLDLNGTANYAYVEQPLLAADEQPIPTASVTGLPTITCKRVVSSDGTLGQYLRTALFYDRYGNVIQKQGTSIIHDASLVSLPNVTTVVYRQHGFVAQVQQTIVAQQSDKFGTFVVRNRFGYDDGGRLRSVWQQNQRGTTPEPEVLVGRYAYNSLGQLTEKNLHSQDEGRSFLQSVDLRYNIHGELVSFNNSDLSASAANDEAPDLFGMALNRQVPDPDLNVTPRFDGGITSVRWKAHNPIQNNQPERERSYGFYYDELGRLSSANFSARSTAGGSFSEEIGAYGEQVQYDDNGNIAQLTRKSQTGSSTATQYSLDDLQYSYGPDGGNLLRAVDDGGDANKGFRDLVQNSNEYVYDTNGNLVQDDNKGLQLGYNALNKVASQLTKNGGQILSDFDADGNLVRRTVVSAQGKASTYYYSDGFIYEESERLHGLAALPTPEGRVVAVTTAPPPPHALQPAAGPTVPPVSIPAPPGFVPAQNTYEGPPRLVYEYQLRDHQGNLRVAFRAESAPRWLRLGIDALSEEGEYPKFTNVGSTLTPSTTSYPAQQGPSYAAVSRTSPGPANTLPVAHGDYIKVSFYYRTPAGVQNFRLVPPVQAPSPKPEMQVAPFLLSAAGGLTAPVQTEPSRAQLRPFQWLAGVQVSLTGLLSHRKKGTALRVPDPGPCTKCIPPVEAYLRWTLMDEAGKTQSSGVVVAPVSAASTNGWVYLSTTLPAVDLRNVASRTGRLTLQLVNDASQPVHFDSLTVRHPQPALLVSQEQHYYPFGLAMEGVAVNTVPAEAISKAQYNAGSHLQDELLGEAANYTTFFRQYDPTLGRFLAVDPLASNYANQSPYQYSNNDPVNFNDPSGAGPFWDWIKNLFSFAGNFFEPDGPGHYQIPSGAGNASQGNNSNATNSNYNGGASSGTSAAGVTFLSSGASGAGMAGGAPPAVRTMELQHKVHRPKLPRSRFLKQEGLQ